MEHKKICVVVGLCVFMQAVGLVSTVSLRRLSERIDLLENTLGNRIEFENTQRHKDFESLMAKLSEISTRIGNWEEKQSSFYVNAESTLDNVGVSENIDSRQSDILKYFINGMKEEKAANVILRRELHDALNEMDSRMKREVSRLDASITKADKIFDERNEQVIMAINNVKDTVLAKISDTSEILRDEINKRIDSLIADQKDTQQIIQNEIEHSIKKQCNLDKTNDITEKAIERLWTNMSASFDESRVLLEVFESCDKVFSKGYRKSGVYRLEGMNVFCDQTTDGGGWTVFQRRMNGEVDFFRNWQDYKDGFGDIEKEFWLGNEKISKLLRQGNHQLRIDMEDFDGRRSYAKYSSFHVGPESTDYTLTVTGFSGGDAKDALDYHNGMKFTTKDRDLDKYRGGNCAALRKGGLWYNDCGNSNLNGLYLTPPEAYKNNYTGIFWYWWKYNRHSLKFVEMKFR